MRAATLLLLVPAIVQAGFFDDVPGLASNVGDFFGGQFKGAESVQANSQPELQGNVGKVVGLLRGIKEKLPVLQLMANDEQKGILRKVDGFLSTVTQFSNQVKSDGEAKFQQNNSKWTQMAKNIFETQGLNQIVSLIAKASAPGSSCLIAAAVLPVIYLLR